MTITWSRRALVAALVVVNLILLSVLFVLGQMRAERDRVEELRQLGATEYPSPISLAEVNLTDQSGAPFDSARLLDRWTLVFFGFTSCSDICPLSVAELGRTLNELSAEQAAQLQVLFVTVDPDRDNPEVLSNYLDSFHEGIVGLTGNMREIESFAAELFVVIDSSPQPHGVAHDGGDAVVGIMPAHSGQVDHSSHLSLIGPQGRLRAVLRPPHRSRDILSVLDYFI